MNIKETLLLRNNVFSTLTTGSADESGPEIMYEFTTDLGGRLDVDIDSTDVDMDIHLLEADSADSTITRAHLSFSAEIPPGRYLIAVDTWTDQGVEYSGPYTLTSI